MVFDEKTILLSIISGLVIGILDQIFFIIHIAFNGKKIMKFVFDFLLVVIALFITFIVALVINDGYLRFFQVALELIGFLSVYFIFEPIRTKILQVKTKINKHKSKVYSLFTFLKLNFEKKRN